MAVKKKAVVKKVAPKKSAKKTAPKKVTETKAVAKKAVAKKAPVKKRAATSKIIIPPVPVTGVTRTQDAAGASTPPVPPASPVLAIKPVVAPKYGASGCILGIVILGIVILSLISWSLSKKSSDEAAPAPIPAVSASAQPSPSQTPVVTQAPAVARVEAPGRFIGNWAKGGKSAMVLTWKAPMATDGLTGYKVETRYNLGDWKVISELPATQLSLEIPKISDTGETSFRVSSVYADGQSAAAKAFGFAGQFE